MKKQLLALALFAATVFTLNAQSYDLAVGVRLGTDLGLSAQLRMPPLGENTTLEFIVQSSLQRKEGMFTLMAEQHFPVFTRRLNLYGGGGFHAGWLNEDPDRPVDAKAPAGISLIAGAEVNFKNINLSYDFKPTINIQGGEQAFYSQTAITLRFIPFKRYDLFESPRDKRKRQRQQARDQRKSSGDGFNWRFWEKD